MKVLGQKKTITIAMAFFIANLPSHKRSFFTMTQNKKTISYLGLFFVVFVWGCSPLLTLELYKYYSPTIRICFSELILLAAYILISKKHIKKFSSEYLKIGIPTGFFLALANISQKIGLMYTTPARYAFLENLSCITVPILVFLLVKKKQSVTTWIASTICLISAFVLNGVSFSGSSWGIGEILCAVSGLLYGFNIAGTGIYANKLHAPLYLATQCIVGFTVSLIFSLVLNFLDFTGSGPIEKIVFSFNPVHLAFAVIVALVSSALCWTIRTNAMKHIDATIVAVIMPFSAVITSILSVLSGKDTLNYNLIVGGALGLLAIFMSSYDDIRKKLKTNQ